MLANKRKDVNTMKIMNNIETIREANGGAKYYKCAFCNNYTTTSYWKMYNHAFNCSYCNSMAYNMGWNIVLGLLFAAIPGI